MELDELFDEPVEIDGMVLDTLLGGQDADDQEG